MVKIAASGVCHTDEVAQQQMIPVPLPAVLGHEGCGIVEKVGEGVTEFQKGDHVLFSFGYCGHCNRFAWQAGRMHVRILMPLISEAL